MTVSVAKVLGMAPRADDDEITITTLLSQRHEEVIARIRETRAAVKAVDAKVASAEVKIEENKDEIAEVKQVIRDWRTGVKVGSFVLGTIGTGVFGLMTILGYNRIVLWLKTHL